ncbi:hypothetical protein HU200_008446 [Digitaria exilis]|uniref:NB-ARC domain-containing protein n=1 Tax=Digitaria exilis TaxID=1010633 RepID=A0A835FNH1_9POAL|nr:hypothetical protein HU200_008446 [Digitaria exilis]
MEDWDNRQETSFDAGKELIVGREEIKKRMAYSIESMPEKIVILPIYGIGGIGKTTFARLLYNDTELKYYSPVWVYVSPRFDLYDLWENNAIQLEDLKAMLGPGDSIKTIVLVTTRSEEIAEKMCLNIKPYRIEELTDEMCWDIIKRKSGFEARHDKEKLVGIGKDIARKCGGVALAAQTLGSMLQSTEYDQWVCEKYIMRLLGLSFFQHSISLAVSYL